MSIDSREPTVKVRENQIVVDLEQLKKLEAVLRLDHPDYKVVDTNPALKLALIDVSLSPQAETEAEANDQLGKLIDELKKTYWAKYRHELTIGKNRIVGSVTGSPYTGGGSGVASPYTGGGSGAASPYTGGITGKGQGGARLAVGETLPVRTEAKRSVRVGILDTRVFEHPDLAGRYLASFGTLVTGHQAAAAAATCPQHQAHANLAHATFIAGVILQRAPDADLDIRRGLDEDAAASSSWDVAVKMAEFADAGVNVLNISFGAVTGDDKAPLVLERAVAALRYRNVAVVAAAGNNGPSSKRMWPAALPQVIAVGADQAGSSRPAAFSPDESNGWVDLMAPGEQVYSTYEGRCYATWDGTSFAAAAVSGVIAYLRQNEDMSGDEAGAWLKIPPDERKALSGPAAMDDIRPA